MTRRNTNELTFIEKEILAIISRAAEAGQACPSNTMFADLTGSTNASEIISSLERKGMIRVQRGNSKRVVTIIATGKRTAGEIKRPHWRERAEHQGRKNAKRADRAIAGSEPMPRPEDLPRVEQGSCFWCGARFEGLVCNCGRGVAA